MTPYFIVLIGLLLVFVEFFVPGGVLGAAGGVLIVVGVVFFAVQATSPWAVLAFIVVTGAVLGVMIKFALWRIKRRGVDKGSLYLNTDQEGYVASKFAKELVGKKGEAISDLKPSGHILVEGTRLQAVSKTGYVVKGTKIEVVGGEGAHLIVKQSEE